MDVHVRGAVCGCLIFLLISPSYGGAGWEYTGPLGPEKWHVQYPDCAGRMQSPINVNTKTALYDPSLDYFDLRQYSACRDCDMVLSNVGGHTAEVLYSGDPIIIRGGSLPDEYVLDQFHFHWGATNLEGSEHTVNYEAAPLELHIVHHMKSSRNSSEAAAHPYGLAVLGFFFKIGKHNSKFDPLLRLFRNITRRDQEIELEDEFSLASLLPPNAKGYFRYFGSLTTPPCYETVIWTLFNDRIEISESQLATFRTLKTIKEGEHEEVPIVNDYRPIQELHERRVYANDYHIITDYSSEIIAQLRAQIEKEHPCPQQGTNAAHVELFPFKMLSLTLVAVVLSYRL